MNEYVISAAPWIPLSAVYPYDENVDLQPTLTKWKDGYTFYYHPLFDHAKDVSINKQSVLYLTSAESFFDFAVERNRGFATLGSYITLQISGLYIKVDTADNNLYLNGTDLAVESYFRLIPNTDGSFSLLQGDELYVTVQQTLPFNLYVAQQLSEDEIDRQKFYFYTADNQRVYITTHILSETYPDYGPQYIERFVSYSPSTYIIRAIGAIPDDDYAFANEYLWTVTGYDLTFSIAGLTRDQTWIHYYNSLNNTVNNTNVELLDNRCVSAVKVNRLVDLPFNTKIDIENYSMDVNIANLKNVQTPEYEYNVRSLAVSAIEP